MSDGTQLNHGAGGDTIQTEDFGSAGKVERVKLVIGAQDTDGGDISSTNPMPQTNTDRMAGENYDFNVVETAPIADAANQTGTALVASGECLFYGWVVNSHTSGTLQIYDGVDNTGTLLFNTITFPAGASIWTLPAAIKCFTGLYMVAGGTINYTPIFRT